MSNDAFRRVRRRLTLWYVGVFAAILLLFGSAVYLAITHQVGSTLDRQLVAATGETERALRIREQERGLPEHAVDALDELRIPGVHLYVFDAEGRPLRDTVPPTFLAPLVHAVFDSGQVWARPEVGETVNERVYGRRITVAGRSYAALATTPSVEVEERYPGLLASFLLAAFGALALVGLGGTALARKSLVPVQQSMERMRRFVADASHELRTPATVLRTRAEVALQRSRSVEEYADLLEQVRRESERLGRLVDGLLLLAAADEDALPMRRQSVYLDDLLVQASELARALAAPQGVALELGSFEEAPIEADPDLVRQLCLILLENAVKYTPSSGTVHADVTANAVTCRLAVRDTGPGIDPETLPHVFERFYRADPARAREGGSGLGLAIAKSIADAHGATIHVDSTPGEGTTVQVAFPRRALAPTSGDRTPAP